ncbi:MAG TPA: ATP-binding protein, partial [Blastocatellia bacterium]|nr:ATP-binding protein [Blastocatellia bacterium]
IKDWVNPFSSFRARILIFATAIVLTAIAAIYYINRHLEQRLAGLVAEHIKAISVSVDLAQSSFPSGEYLDDLLEKDGRITVGMEENHIIHKISVVDANERVIDSTDPDDIGKTSKDVLGDLMPLNLGKVRPATNSDGREPEMALTYPVITEKGQRKVVIIISPHLLAEIVREESRERLIAIVVLSLLLILIIALTSWRFTRPIQELSKAALRVSSGDFDFSVPAMRRDEMGALASAFNKMLAGLRDKRELEVRLQRVERAALTGRIAAGIAHEIRNPLNFINLTIDFIRDKFAPGAETARADYTKLCDSVKDELARLNRMVSDFLSYGRPARLRLREVNALGLIEEVMNLVRAQADQQGVSLSVTEEAGDGDQAYDGQFKGDLEQLKTCFSNLAINAVQAMAGGGSLKITLRPQKHNIRLEVADSGPGIAPEALGQIFEPYFSTKETGIGLGLALTRKLIEDHGGQIMVSSEVGVGTTFMVILPREPVSEPHPASLPQPVLRAS